MILIKLFYCGSAYKFNIKVASRSDKCFTKYYFFVSLIHPKLHFLRQNCSNTEHIPMIKFLVINFMRLKIILDTVTVYLIFVLIIREKLSASLTKLIQK